ncbi:Ku protein [Streptomyces lydicus]|uniref:Ku protein n=1 Tax=Streptomyces lydicus TaxID=47763 RepID=UPI0033199AC3
MLGVEEAGAHPYRLLRDAMKQSGQVGVARMALRGPERLVVLREQPQARNVSAAAEMGARYSPTSTPPRTNRELGGCFQRVGVLACEGVRPWTVARSSHAVCCVSAVAHVSSPRSCSV